LPLEHLTTRIKSARAWSAIAGKAFLGSAIAGRAATGLAADVFAVRVASAGLAYLIQILLARWMGAFEYGIYVYAWTWMVMIGGLADLGFAMSAQRFIPAYCAQAQPMLLRGFLYIALSLPMLGGTLICLVGLFTVYMCRNLISAHNIVPLYLACLCLPFFTLTSVQDGIARAYNWIFLGLAPDYLVRPAIILVGVAAVAMLGIRPDSVVVMLTVAITTAAVALGQFVVLQRRLKPAGSGEMQLESKLWFQVSLPIFLFASFYLILTNVDVLVLEYFSSPQNVAVYYAVSKSLALVAFVSFSVSAVSARRFSEYWTSGRRDRIESYLAQSIRWTFWPLLAGATFILLAGRPLLALFGPAFVDGYGLMFIMALGLVIQSSTGPAEAVLNMLHNERTCAAIYAVAFAFNFIGCLLLVPRFGAAGAAIAVASALTLKSLLLFLFIKRRLSLHAFVWSGARFRAQTAHCALRSFSSRSSYPAACRMRMWSRKIGNRKNRRPSWAMPQLELRDVSKLLGGVAVTSWAAA
jgi:O-antigen/teichoic acid export membrane protein